MTLIKNISQLTIVRCILFIFSLFFSIGISAQTANWKVKPEYDEAKIVNEYMIIVKANGRYGIIGFDGGVIAECRYDHITTFVNGYALLLRGNILCGNVTEEGKVTLFNEIYTVDMDNPHYSEGFLSVKKNGRWGYLDPNGRIVIETVYLNAYPFSHGYAAVRDSKGYFMHINKTGRISYLGAGFNDENLIFASSFNNNEKGNPVAVVITDKGKAYQRDLTGNKVQNFYPISGITEISRDMRVGRYRLVFDPSLKLAEFYNGSSHMSYDIPEVHEVTYTPVVYDVKSTLCGNGKYDLYLAGRKVLSEQFDAVCPLTSSYILVCHNGRYGILKLASDEMVDITLDNDDYVLSHCHTVKCTAKINLPASANIWDFTIRGIKDGYGNNIPYDLSGSHLSFSFKPNDLISAPEKRFMINYAISGIEYPGIHKDISIGWKSSFKVDMTKKASLDSLNMAYIQLNITNSSEISSSQCTVYVNGRKVRQIVSFAPWQTVSIPLNESVKIEDEDVIDKNYRVVISEMNCPDFEVSRKVRYERYYKNNETYEN